MKPKTSKQPKRSTHAAKVKDLTPGKDVKAGKATVDASDYVVWQRNGGR